MKTCEYCSSLNDGNYGSGRFCNEKCARGFSTKIKREDINVAVSKKLKLDNLIFIRCEFCDEEIKIKRKGRRFCSNDCANKKRKISPDGINKVTAFRQRQKQKAVEYKGGECVLCGYKKCNWALQFHHLNPEEKDFGIGGRGCPKKWEVIKKELDKCILVCGNCHTEIHAGLHDLEKILTNREIGESVPNG